jgi:activator of HSP90 ATPase
MNTKKSAKVFATALTVLAVGLTRAQTNRATAESTLITADKRTFLHQEVEFNASAQRLYDILLDSKQFAAFSGDSAEISPEVGGSFSMFGGRIVGRNIELIPNQRIVQAWREASWPPGVYSIVKFELKEKGSKTRVVLDHTGFGEGDFQHLNPGWKLRYWDPLEKFLAAGANH